MRFRTTAVLLLSLFGITLDANAQSTGRVSGRVLDQTGAVPRSARIGIQFSF